MINLTLSEQQLEAIEVLDDPTVVELEYGGGAGGGKTLLVCLWILKQVKEYPGVRIGLGRKEITKLKQTTVVSLLQKAHPIMNVRPDTFTYNDQKGTISYMNGSMIQLVDLARQPSDPDYDSLGSLELTHAIIEEAGEITKKAKDVFGSRRNRYLNLEYGITGKLILTGNPSQNFTRQEYYEPYARLGGGTMQKWEIGGVEVNGQMETAYRAFIRALAIDNPFISQNYIEDLKRLPAAERKRLLEGNWDYADDDNQLIKSHVFERSFTGDLPRTGKRAIGVDVADKGNDQTILTLIDNGAVVDQVNLRIDPLSPIPVSEQTALEIIKYAQINGFSAKDAGNIGVDVVGIGVGVRDFMKARGWHIFEYVAGSKANDGYKNLRSESYWVLSQALESGKLVMFNQLQTVDELRRQLISHEYEVQDRIVMIKSKDKIKEIIGRSPDHADSLCIAYWVYGGTTKSTKILF